MIEFWGAVLLLKFVSKRPVSILHIPVLCSLQKSLILLEILSVYGGIYILVDYNMSYGIRNNF